jgi:hypothetical protein
MDAASAGEGKTGLHWPRNRIPGLTALAVAAAACFAASPSAGQAPQRDPQLDAAVMLVRNALTAVNHGNLTGNYTVLRDLGAPVFRERNSAAQLAAIFQRLRDQKSDLSPILIQEPVFTEAPAINQAGELQLAGFFPTQPLQVPFRLAFQRVQGRWMIDTVSVGTAAPQASPQNAGVSMARPVDIAPAGVATRPPEAYPR